MIENEKKVLNEYGKIAEQQCFRLQRQYPFVVLHSFVVMPNHIHGIIEIDDAIVGVGVGTGSDLSKLNGDHNIVATGHDHLMTGNDLSLREEIKIKSLSQLMGAYKATTSKQIHL